MLLSLPSSHCSPASTTPLPHSGGVSILQLGSQPSPGTLFPSSHSSLPVHRKPSPHTASLQKLVQASLLLLLPSSHCSSASTTPSPQSGGISMSQSSSQPSPGALFPSSHSSLPVHRKLSPQYASLQKFVQASLLLLFPSSHCSPASTTPLPQSGGISNQQFSSQPSPPAVFPSSHCSTPVHRKPSPHRAEVQSVTQASLLSSLPSSHSSPISRTALPHSGGASIMQSPSQPSPDQVLPSSHSSPASTSTTPFPQISLERQSLLQPSPETVLPSSQASPISMTPFPQSPQMFSFPFIPVLPQAKRAGSAAATMKKYFCGILLTSLEWL